MNKIIIIGTLLCYLISLNNDENKTEINKIKIKHKSFLSYNVNLRDDLLTYYREITLNRQFNIDGDNDASFIIKNYIQPGMSFDDAAAILSGAGFSIAYFPNLSYKPPDYYTDLEKKSLIARIDLITGFSSYTTVAVTIYPKNLSDGFYTVGEIKANIRFVSI